MPIRLIPCIEDPLCHGYRWVIGDEQRLAELVAKLMLGHHRHVQKVLDGDVQGPTPQVSERMIDDLVRKLGDPDSEGRRYQRDGWVFQMISWVAARLTDSKVIMAIPHSQEAEKGFDNLIVKFANENDKVDAVVICEDKATDNSRKTIREQVWPEIERFETGHRDHELVNEVTAILERCRDIVDVDKCMADIFWEKSRYYRIAITTNRQDDENHRRNLFNGYNQKVSGPRERRVAETIQIDRLREWMDNFCLKVIIHLEGFRCTIP